MTHAGRIAAVFGGTGALGHAVATALHGAGAEVVVADRAEPPHDRRLDGVDYRAVDAADEGAVADFFDQLGGAPWAVVDVVGGFASGQAVADLDLDVLHTQLQLNLVTATLVTKHALRHMRDAGAGRVVLTSSRVATQAGKEAFPYAVSKLGVIKLVEAAAAETAGSDITVNCILPSVIDTPANRAAMPRSDHSRWPTPEQIARVVTWLTSDDAALVSGAALPVYGRA